MSLLIGVHGCQTPPTPSPSNSDGRSPSCEAESYPSTSAFPYEPPSDQVLVDDQPPAQPLVRLFEGVLLVADESDCPERLAFELPTSQYDALLDFLFDNTLQPQLSKNFSTDQLAKCRSWISKRPFDYHNQQLVFRMTTPLHDESARMSGNIIVEAFKPLVAAAGLRIEKGARHVCIPNTNSTFKPDASIWIQPVSQRDHKNSPSKEPPLYYDDPGLVLEIGWSHPTPAEQCARYLTYAGGKVRCVISVTLEYVPPEYQPDIDEVPSITVSAWRLTQETPPQPIQFVDNLIIWRSATPTRARHKEEEAVLTLFPRDLSRHPAIDAIANTPVNIDWTEFSHDLRECYSFYRKEERTT